MLGHSPVSRLLWSNPPHGLNWPVSNRGSSCAGKVERWSGGAGGQCWCQASTTGGAAWSRHCSQERRRALGGASAERHCSWAAGYAAWPQHDAGAGQRCSRTASGVAGRLGQDSLTQFRRLRGGEPRGPSGSQAAGGVWQPGRRRPWPVAGYAAVAMSKSKASEYSILSNHNSISIYF